jgi:hypothetical protein
MQANTLSDAQRAAPALEPIMQSESAIYMGEKTATWETTLRKITLVILRLMLGYLFFTQLFWKMPPTFGCPDDFSFTTANSEGRLVRTSGLCDWIGVEQVWSTRPRPFFVADIPGPSKISVDLGFLTRLNGMFIENVVMPNIRWFGYIVWLSEAFIFVSLFFGILSRLGALVSIGITAQLMLGLAGISSPYEWEWAYNQMFFLSLLLFAFAPGRVFGIDSFLRPLLQAAATGGNKLAKLLLWLT